MNDDSLDPSDTNASQNPPRFDANAPAPGPGASTNGALAKAIWPARIFLPPALAEILRLTKAGISNDVIIAYVQKSAAAYPVNAAQIVYLRDLGISTPVLKALVTHVPEAGPNGADMRTATLPQDALDPEGGAPSEIYMPGPPPVPTSISYNLFYKSLAPYGRWMDLPGAGWCWQPAVAMLDSTWRPYGNNGNWLWSDCGWYWNSRYSWGWAPFHFGRWSQNPRYGWVWRPELAWSPAWVSWRKSAQYAGWAPLPPGSGFDPGSGWTFNGMPVNARSGFGLPASAFTFVPYSRFSDRRAFDYRLAGSLTAAVFNQTVSDNNFSVGRNRRMVSLGIDPQQVQAASGRPLRRVAVRERDSVRERDRIPDPASGGNAFASEDQPADIDPQIAASLPYQFPAAGLVPPVIQNVVVDSSVVFTDQPQPAGAAGSASTGNTAATSSTTAQTSTTVPSPAANASAQANTATPWLPTGQTAAAGPRQPYGVPGVPLVPNNGANPYLPIGQKPGSGKVPAYGVPGVPVAANNGETPFLPVGQTAASGTPSPFGVPGVPLMADNHATPFLPSGQQAVSGTTTPFGTLNAQASASVPRFANGSSSMGLAQSPGFSFLPGAPTLPGGRILPGAPTLPGGPILPNVPSFAARSGSVMSAMSGAHAAAASGGGGGGGHH